MGSTNISTSFTPTTKEEGLLASIFLKSELIPDVTGEEIDLWSDIYPASIPTGYPFLNSKNLISKISNISIENENDWVITKVNQSRKKTELEINQEHAKNYFNKIKTAFGLKNQTQVAHAMKVTRQTITNRLKGSGSNQRNKKRESDLIVLASQWKHTFHGRHNKRLHEKIYNDRSVWELLGDDELNLKHIMYAGSLLSLSSL